MLDLRLAALAEDADALVRPVQLDVDAPARLLVDRPVEVAEPARDLVPRRLPGALHHRVGEGIDAAPRAAVDDAAAALRRVLDLPPFHLPRLLDRDDRGADPDRVEPRELHQRLQFGHEVAARGLVVVAGRQALD